MFISFKDVPVIVTLEEFVPNITTNRYYDECTGYSFAAESININTNKNVNFYFEQKSPMDEYGPFKRNNRTLSSQGPVTTIDISYNMSVPEEAIFFLAMSPSFGYEKTPDCANNAAIDYNLDKNYGNEIMKKYNLIFGSGIFTRSYLQSYSFEVVPNNIIKSNISFISYSPFSGFDSNILDFLKKSKGAGRDYNINAGNNVSTNWCPAENFNFKLYKKHITGQNDICILNSQSGNLLRYGYNYKAEIQPVYRNTERYPYRVIYNKEEISMDVDIDYQDFFIDDPQYYIYKSELKIKNLKDIILEPPKGGVDNWEFENSSFGCNLSLESGTLMSKQGSVKVNEIMNNRFSLKYYV